MAFEQCVWPCYYNSVDDSCIEIRMQVFSLFVSQNWQHFPYMHLSLVCYSIAVQHLLPARASIILLTGVGV